MQLPNGRTAIAFVFAFFLGTGELFAQPAPAKRNFEAEIYAAVEAAKPAAGLNFSVLW